MKHTAVIIAIFILNVCNTLGQERTTFIQRMLRILKPPTDTTYVCEGSQAFGIRPYIRSQQGITSFQYTDSTNTNSYSFAISDIGSLYAGLELAYRGFSFGYDIEPASVFGNKRRSGYNFNFSYYGQRIGFDFFFSTKDESKLKDSNDKELYNGPIDCFSTSRFQSSIYYVKNSSHFSLPAAFSQSQIQIKSSGSLIFGVNTTNTLIHLNASKVPTELDSLITYNHYMFSHFRQTMVGVSCGYGRNIMRKYFLFHFSVQPYLPVYLSKKIRLTNGDKFDSELWDLNIGAKIRGAVHWFYSHHSINLNAIIDSNITNQNSLQATDAIIRGYLSYRYMF